MREKCKKSNHYLFAKFSLTGMDGIGYITSSFITLSLSPTGLKYSQRCQFGSMMYSFYLRNVVPFQLSCGFKEPLIILWREENST